MQFKKDTKEKFSVYTPQIEILTANMADILITAIKEGMTTYPPHAIVNMIKVKGAEQSAVDKLLETQCAAYDSHISFVICHICKELETSFQESINLVPTESEAWDIVQMEEIERELLGSDDEHSN